MLGRGHIYPKLLSYLADRTMRGEVPKEFDISVDVFGKAKGDIDAPDAQTRVHIYKLRARLDAYYAGAGKHESLRLEIPKGAYHLCAVANETTAAPPSPAVSPATARRPVTRYASRRSAGCTRVIGRRECRVSDEPRATARALWPQTVMCGRGSTRLAADADRHRRPFFLRRQRLAPSHSRHQDQLRRRAASRRRVRVRIRGSSSKR